MKTDSQAVRRSFGFIQLVSILHMLALLVCQGGTGPLDSWQVKKQLGGTASVVYGNGRFVVAASGSAAPRLLVSTNGSDWTAYLPPEAGGQLVSMQFANGNFLLLISRYVYQGTNGMALYSSTDGISWVLRRFNQSSPMSTPISSVGGGNGLYVMAASDLSTSSDLVSWRQAVYGATGIQGFASGRGLIIGTPWWGAGLIVSSDGLIWEYVDPPGGLHYSSISFANGRFGAFAPGSSDAGTPPAVAVSPYGFDWTFTVLPDYTNCTRLSSGNELFFLLSSGTNVFYSSSDGLDWAAHSFGTNVTVTDLTFGGNSYVAVGDVILQSGLVTNAALVPANLSIRNVPGITIYGPVGQAYEIEAAQSLSDTNSFLPVTNVIATTSPFLWLDTEYTNIAPRFYRAMTRPQQP